MEVVSVVTYVCQVWTWRRTWTDGAWKQSGDNMHEITMDEENNVTRSFFIFPPYLIMMLKLKKSNGQCMFYTLGQCVSRFLFSRVPLSQYTTYTHASRYCKYQRLLIGYWSSGMFRYLAGLKSSNLPPSESTML
jgi:hypothetical protein